MQKLLIIGAGSFSPEVEELAGLLGYIDIAFLDDNPSTAYCSPVIGTTDDIAYFRSQYDTAIVALGNNNTRINDQGNKYITPIQSGLLVYPSMNEVNYTAFGEVTEEYHDELYGFIDGQGWMNDYENGKTQIPYVKEFRDRAGNVTGTRNITHTLTHYIRDVQHHPENTNNVKYTDQQLAQSIAEMRNYIEAKLATTAVWLGDEE